VKEKLFFLFFFQIVVCFNTEAKAQSLKDSTNKRTFFNTQPTPEVVMIKFLESLERSDTTALLKMMITENEYKEWVWWEEEASKPKYNVPVQSAWEMFYMNSVKGLYKILGLYGGKKIELSTLSFQGAPKRYQTYIVQFNPVITILDTTNKENKLFGIGAFIESNGRHKIYYYTDKHQ
jgi:hypothetical protein